MHEAAKKRVGAAAADLIHDGMVVGLGTGSTAYYFIEHLIRRCQEGLKIQAAASSEESQRVAQRGGIFVRPINDFTSLDITVDGADEIDAHKRMIKGGGGALLREKIVASMSKEMVVIVDESKVVKNLGKKKLPVEIVPFGYPATLIHLKNLGYEGKIRLQKDHSFYVTDNGNYLFDIAFENTLEHPEKDHDLIRRIPGVVDTGFFFNLAGRVLIGFFDGQIVTRP